MTEIEIEASLLLQGSPAVGDVEIVSPIAKPIYRAFGILIDALKETSDGL